MSQLNTLLKWEDLETDGKVIDRVCDPPGQKSVYISPGDTAKEVYRLTTFLKFPAYVPVNPQELAAVGFLYTGYKDRVKCFSCGLSVENWALGDNVQDSRWHKIDCAVISGYQSGNVSIASDSPFSRFGNEIHKLKFTTKSTCTSKVGVAKVNDVSAKKTKAGHFFSSKSNSNFDKDLRSAVTQQNLNTKSSYKSIYKPPSFSTITSAFHEQFVKSLDLRSEEDRLKSFANWSEENTVIVANVLARSGFFYLGNLDRVQCFSCGGTLRNWKYNDVVDVEHKSHYPHCKMVLNIEEHNIPLLNKTSTKSSQQSPSSSEINFAELLINFPCLYPVNPHMKEEYSRSATFDQRWPINKVRTTPDLIARAGFYFLGDRDRVKCWYCNGGLQNWDYNDEPWTEHAKWFPSCEFLLQKKGPTFVSEIVRLFPNLRRPILRNGYDVVPSQSQSSPQSPLVVFDPKVELEKNRKKIDVLIESETAKLAIEMGFSKSSVRKTIEKKWQNDQEMYHTLSSLVDDLVATSDDDDDDDDDDELNIFSKTSSTSRIENNEQFTEKNNLQPSSSGANQKSARSLEERMKELEDERQCKICLDQLAELVFVPCGHLCSCLRCARSLRKCPICRVQITKMIRTYLS